MLAGAMAMSAFSGHGQVVDVVQGPNGNYTPRRGRNVSAIGKQCKPDRRSPAKLRNSIGKIGLGMHASGRNALGGGTVSPKKDIDKGPARTLSVRDAKLTMATGRRYNRMPSWERQRRLAALFNMKG